MAFSHFAWYIYCKQRCMSDTALDLLQYIYWMFALTTQGWSGDLSREQRGAILYTDTSPQLLPQPSNSYLNCNCGSRIIASTRTSLHVMSTVSSLMASIRKTKATFWLRQEPKESQCEFVRPVQVCLEQSIFIFLAQIFKQSVSSQSVSQQSVSQQSFNINTY